DAKLFAELRFEHVLPAIPARDGKIRRSIPAPAGEICDQLRVLVVRMRGDVKHAAHVGEGLQILKNRDARRRIRSANRRRQEQAQQQKRGTKQNTRSFHSRSAYFFSSKCTEYAPSSQTTLIIPPPAGSLPTVISS